jgi:cell division septal protein FtsQ|tara:strand:- start:1435 stop:1671 length:237 start_codon:yes stop_codon:yes gene_type:complete
MSNTTKRGRGRPKGSTSFISIKLADLINNLGPNANVSVSKKWLDSIGIEIQESSAPSMVVSSTTDELEATETIQFQIH